MSGIFVSVKNAIAKAIGTLNATLAGSGGAGLVGFLQSGAGAVSRWIQDKLRESISTNDYGTLQEAVNAAIAQGKALKVVGNVVTNTGITAAGNLAIIGEGREQSSIKFTGTGTFINQTSGDLLSFSRVRIMGNGSSDGPIAVSGSVAFKAFNNSTSNECDFIFWETVSVWQGGYYHKYFNTFFRYNKYLFTNWDQNNFAFSGCTFSNLQRGISIQSGEGPITFTGCSIENVADKFLASVSSRGVCANFVGCFMEQGASVVPPSGITSTSGFYSVGVLVYTDGSEVYPCTFIGNTVFTPGFFRFFWNASAGGCHVISKGNNFISRGVTPPDGIYVLGGTKVVAELSDVVVGSLAGGLATYVANYPTDMDGCTIYDPITKQWLRPSTQGWTNATLTNGFANEGGSFANVSYFLAPNGKVKLRGALNGFSATSGIAFTLPAGYRPSTIKTFPVASVWGAGSTLQLQVYPSGAAILNGTAPFNRQIGLDGVEFYVNE